MNMFKPTTAKTPEDYIARIAEPRRSDIEALDRIIRTHAPELPVKMFGSIIGYGSYHYKYASGREGDWFPLGLASQKNYISLYSCGTIGGAYIAEGYKSLLPKASIGKSCIRFKKLADVDQTVLVEIIIKTAKLKSYTM